MNDSRIRLTVNDLFGLVLPRGEPSRWVAINQTNQLLRRFIAAKSTIKDVATPDDLQDFAGWVEAFASLPSNIQRSVVAYPTFGFWLDTIETLLREKGEATSELLAEIKHFNRFLLAGHVLAKRPLSVSLQNTALFSVPFTHKICRSADGNPQDFVCHVTDEGTLTIAGQVKIEEIPLTASGFELNFVDPDFRIGESGSFEYAKSLSAAEVSSWIASLDACIEIISSHSMELVDELKLFHRVFVPLVTDSFDVHQSATFEEAPGLMAISWTPDLSHLMEAIIHELHHQKLYAVMQVDPLVVGPTRETLYSPWRPDPRPAHGLFHAVFVFLAVFWFWKAVLRVDRVDNRLVDRETIERRLIQLQLQLERGLEVLDAEVTFTEIGTMFFGSMKQRFCDLKQEKMGAAATRVFAEVREVVNRHERTWFEVNKQ